MSLQVIYSPLALGEMHEIAEYLARVSSPILGLRFLKAIEDTCASLADMPEMAGKYESDDPRLAELRVFTVRGFPNHLVFYDIDGCMLRVVHVLHGGRDLDRLL